MEGMPSLGEMLRRAIDRLRSASSVDRRTVEELVRGIQRALLMADVEVSLVQKLSENIRKRALEERVPPGISRRDHIVKVVYEELVKLLGEEPARLEIVKRPYVVMMVGIQGTGKTTTVAKLANYLAKNGYRVGVVCADTYRPGAREQLQQLLSGLDVKLYWEDGGDAVAIARHGVENLSKDGVDVVLIDTAGRHRSQEDLMEEMRSMERAVKPDEVILIIDATIGQQAGAHAKAFHEATKIGSIILTKMDTSAKGGGALSAIAATGARIKFLGTGERIDDIELFDPKRYVGRLLGLGDIEGLLEKIKLAEVKVSESQAQAFLKGEFTLEQFVNQLKEMRKAGPLSKLLSKLPIPGMAEIPSEAAEQAERQIDRWHAIILSMTEEERRDPHILNSSRIRRIARGAGVSERDVKTLIKQYKMTKKLMKTAKRSPQKILRQLYKT